MQHMARSDSQGLETTRRWASLPLVPVPIAVVAWPTVFQHVELKAAIGFGLQPRKAELVPIGLGYRHPTPVPLQRKDYRASLVCNVCRRRCTSAWPWR